MLWLPTPEPKLLLDTSDQPVNEAAVVPVVVVLPVSNIALGSAPSSANTGGTLYSSAFLVTTYFGAATGSLTADNDAFKINTFTVGTCAGTLSGGTTGTGAGGGNGASCSTTRVPEPGSLALAGLAMFGVVVSSRRRLANIVRG